MVVCAAGSMPGDLHKLWRPRDPKRYHVEYGYSCMGYEIAGGLGVKMAAPDREVFVLVGDGSYLMMAQEIVTAVPEGVKLIVVLVQNHGFASIGALSETVGSQRFGTWYRYRGHGDDDAADRPGRQRGEPGRRAICAHDDRRVRARAAEAAASDAHHRHPDRDRPAGRARRTRRRGGTCRSPRSPRWTAPDGARAATRKAKQRT